MKGTERLDYHAYILRFWAEEGRHVEPRAWRFMLQDTRSGEQKCFTSLAALTAYLTEEKLLAQDDGRPPTADRR